MGMTNQPVVMWQRIGAALAATVALTLVGVIELLISDATIDSGLFMHTILLNLLTGLQCGILAALLRTVTARLWLIAAGVATLVMAQRIASAVSVQLQIGGDLAWLSADLGVSVIYAAVFAGAVLLPDVLPAARRFRGVAVSSQFRCGASAGHRMAVRIPGYFAGALWVVALPVGAVLIAASGDDSPGASLGVAISLAVGVVAVLIGSIAVVPALIVSGMLRREPEPWARAPVALWSAVIYFSMAEVSTELLLTAIYSGAPPEQLSTLMTAAVVAGAFSIGLISAWIDRPGHEDLG